MPQPRQYQNAAQRQAAYRRRNEQAAQALLASRGLPPMPAIPAMPGTTRWSATLRQIQSLAQMAREEMAMYADQRLEAWQESENANQHQERQQIFEDIVDLTDTWN